MLINLRNALMAGKRLPYDAEVEYLETDGSAYINTGAKIYNDTSVVVVWYSNYSTSTASYFFGSDNSTDRFYFREYNGNASYSTGSWWQNTNISTVGTHTIEMSNNGISVDGTASSRTGAAKTGDGNFCLFKVAAGNSPSGMRCYSCKIYQNNTLVRDYIPVRKGTVGYLYDRVSGKLFGNAGTGDFVLGQDVVPVEYIESHGTEYINTGTLIEMTDRVDCTFELTAYGNVTLAGGRVDSSNYSLAIWAYTNAERRIRFDLLSNNHGGIATSIAPTLGQEYKVSKIGERNFVDGVEVQSNPSVAYAPVRTCYLFAMNNGGTASFIGNLRIKDFSIGSKLKYRPVRVGTDGAMMDVLTRRIYRNAGTGAFTYGNDLKYPIPAE